jgi:hypothetical protein
MGKTGYDDILRDLDTGGPEGNVPATVAHLIGDAWEHVKDQVNGVDAEMM